MNIRKPVDYSAMFKALDDLIAVSLPQMELCSGLAGWSAAGQGKVSLSLWRSTCAVLTLTPLGSLLGTCQLPLNQKYPDCMDVP